MENNIVRHARLVNFTRFHFLEGESDWEIPDNEKLGLPVSESYLRSVLPVLNDVDPEIRSLLADMLNENGGWRSWYLLALESLVGFFADL